MRPPQENESMRTALAAPYKCCNGATCLTCNELSANIISLCVAAIERLVAAPGPVDVAAGVRSIVDLCARHSPHTDWPAIRAIDWGADVPRLRGWFRETLIHQAPNEPLAGVYFACCHPVQPSRATADLEFIGTREFDATDVNQEWIFTRHYVPKTYAESAALDQLYGLSYRTHDWRHPAPGALANDAEWPVGLAFGVLAARAIVEELTGRDVRAKSDRVGIAAGWDEGDLLVIGEITARGFVRATEPA